MIDFHSHILPNVDDGSKSIEESINLIKEAEQAGFNSIISTSHYIEGYYEVENEQRKEIINNIKEIIDEQKIKMNIFLGNENYISDNIVQLIKDNKAATINGSDYILFETSLNAKPLNLYNMVYEMMQNNLKPILAHPERYSYIQENPQIVFDLIEKGVLMQSNYASIAGYYGKRAQIISKKMLENNMVHFLGTDVHRQRTIYPKIEEILDKITKIVGKDKLKELTTTNAELVLKNEVINITEPTEIKFTLIEKLKMKQ